MKQVKHNEIIETLIQKGLSGDTTNLDITKACADAMTPQAFENDWQRINVVLTVNKYVDSHELDILTDTSDDQEIILDYWRKNIKLTDCRDDVINALVRLGVTLEWSYVSTHKETVDKLLTLMKEYETLRENPIQDKRQHRIAVAKLSGKIEALNDILNLE